ncbi:MAG: BTAD domain-containing putative transcriptional regulator [Pseudonocardiaceae bacterium]
MINFRILGPLEVTKAGRSLPLGGRKQRAVLAILLLNANQTVPIDRLISEVWSDRTPGNPLNTLQVYVSNLRRILEPARSGNQQQLLITKEPGYRIQVELEQLDVLQFLKFAAMGRSMLDENRYEEAAAYLHGALELWRGPALVDLADEPFAEGELVVLEESRLVATEARIAADLALGRAEETVGELNSLVLTHPYREHFRGLLMSALYRSGRQAESLAAYQATRKTLRNDLGVDPGPELKELERSILAQINLGNVQRHARPFVLYHDGDGKQHIVELDAAQSPLTIGRRSSNDISLTWDQKISRMHARLERGNDGWDLVDEGRSRNGSYVNGERVETRHPLCDADVVRLGTTVLLYRAPTVDGGGGTSRETGVTVDVSSGRPTSARNS